METRGGRHCPARQRARGNGAAAEELRTLIHKRQHWIEKWDGTIQGTLAIIAGLLSRDNEKEAERQARMMVHHALMYGRFKADIIRAERRLKELEGEE